MEKAAMKHKEVTIKALRFENGDMILAVNQDSKGRAYQYFVKTSDGVMVYNPEEMKEIYGFYND